MPAFHLYLFEFPANAVVVEVWVAFHLYLLEFPANAVVVEVEMLEDVPAGTEFP